MHQTRNKFIKYNLWILKLLVFHCCARNVSLDFYVIQIYIYIPFIIFKAHFPVKPNASLLGKICSPAGIPQKDV